MSRYADHSFCDYMVGLEQLMHITHIHGDGGETTGPHRRRPSDNVSAAVAKAVATYGKRK